MSETALERVLSSEVTKTALEFAAKAKEHPIGTALGTLGLVGAYALYKLLRRSIELSYIDGPGSSSFMWGHIPQLFDSINGEDFQANLLRQYGTFCRLKGVMGEDVIWTADPRAIHEMIGKDYDSFRESDDFLSWVKVVTGDNILTVHGQKHKHQRKLLNPVFTPKHMRDLVPTIGTIADRLEDVVMDKIQENGGAGTTIDIFKWMNYAALEMIGQAGVGHSFGVMQDKESDYLKAAGRFFPTIFQLWYIRPFLPKLMKIGPRSFRRFVVEHTPIQAVQELKVISKVMDEMAVGLYDRKKEAAASGTLHAQVAAGKDIMTSLLKQNELIPPSEQMSEKELIGQVNGLVFAGSDTTSSALARALYLLTVHPDVQTTLRAEVCEAFKLHGSNLDYDQLNALTYLDAICRETLRLHPPVLFVERVAQKDWVLPLQHAMKSKDGRTMITEVPIKKGAHIYISILAANRDKQIWGEDADEFRPSRWLEELPLAVRESKIPGVYSSTMTFLGGPRSCIGFKFSQLEMKIVLAKLINAFKFELGEHQINWGTDGIVKPYVRYADGTKSPSHTMPMKVSIV